MCMSCSRLQLDAKPPFVYLVREGSIIKSNETIEEKELFCTEWFINITSKTMEA